MAGVIGHELGHGAGRVGARLRPLGRGRRTPPGAPRCLRRLSDARRCARSGPSGSRGTPRDRRPGRPQDTRARGRCHSRRVDVGRPCEDRDRDAPTTIGLGPSAIPLATRPGHRRGRHRGGHRRRPVLATGPHHGPELGLERGRRWSDRDTHVPSGTRAGEHPGADRRTDRRTGLTEARCKSVAAGGRARARRIPERSRRGQGLASRSRRSTQRRRTWRRAG